MKLQYISPYPKFDSHAHLLGEKTSYVEILNAAHVRAVLNVSFGNSESPEWISQYEADLRADTERFPRRFFFCPSFNVTRFEEPGYTREVVKKLSLDFDRRQAVAVKIWKDLGMMLRDRRGRYVFCDDPRLAPVFDFIASRGLPIVMRIGDPKAAWLPLDSHSLHSGYYRSNPDFHLFGKPNTPSYEEILQHRDALIERYPDTCVVCAHLGSIDHDLDMLAEFLGKHPNAAVDSAARIADLRSHPKSQVRDFFSTCRSRVLYGTDWEPEPPKGGIESPNLRKWVDNTVRRFQEDFRFFEETLALPPEVLEDFYLGNAVRFFRLADL